MEKNLNNVTDKVCGDLNLAKEFVERANGKKVVGFFGSARIKETDQTYKDTYKIANELSKLGYTILTGGGPGLMEAGSRGASDANGESIGVSIKLPFEEKPNPYLNDNHTFKNFSTRKIVFATIANAYVVLPGGVGTMDEVYEILTLMQCGILPEAKVVLYDADFWELHVRHFKEQMLPRGMINQSDIDRLVVINNPDDVIKFVHGQLEG